MGNFFGIIMSTSGCCWDGGTSNAFIGMAARCNLDKIRTRRNCVTSSSLLNELLCFRAGLGIQAPDMSLIASSAVGSSSFSSIFVILRTVIPQLGLPIGRISVAVQESWVCKTLTRRLPSYKHHHSTFGSQGRCRLVLVCKRPCSCLPSARARSTDPMVGKGQCLD